MRIKPLQWRDGGGAEQADGTDCQYQVTRDGQLVILFADLGGHPGEAVEDYPSVNAAKAAAWEHHVRGVMQWIEEDEDATA